MAVPVATHTTDADGEAAEPIDVGAVHRAHGDFVWATLQRLGVRGTDREDVFQEVFVVVHRRLATFDGSSKMTTWLFGICVRVASAHRRRAYVRRETPADLEGHPALSRPRGEPSPEDDAMMSEARERLRAILDEMDLEKRAVFVMYTVEEMSCERIAETIGIPVGTVHSRLHAGRKQFQAAVARQQARDARRGGR